MCWIAIYVTKVRLDRRFSWRLSKKTYKAC